MIREYCRKLTAVCAAVCLLLPCGAQVRLSPAFETLEKGLTMAKRGIAGSAVSVEKDELDRAFGRETERLRVTALPTAETGTVYIGALPAVKGQILPRETITFVPKGDRPVSVSFCVRDESDGTPGAELTCFFHLLPGVNLPPQAASLTMTTSENVSAMTVLSANDPENDAVTFSVSAYPSHGTLTLSREGGYVCYTPRDGYTGRDGFSYTVTDAYGSVSRPAKVGVKVSKPPKGRFFDDLEGHWAKNAVLRVTETGLMDTGNVFSPDGLITRGDFLAMALICAGKEKEIAFTSVTDFADDAQIPLSIKSYAAYAKAKGIVEGVADENGRLCFRSLSPLSRAEAAVIVSRILRLKENDRASVPVFADADAVPAWASAAMRLVCSAGIFRGRGGGRMCPSDEVTRAETAQLLCEIMDRT